MSRGLPDLTKKTLADPPADVIEALKKTTRKKRDSRQKKQQSDPYKPSELAFWCYKEYVKGRSQYAIADEINASRDSVYAYVRRVREYLAEQMLDEIKELRYEHVERLQHIHEEAMAAWERSKLDAVSESKSEGGKDGDRTTKTRTGQCGNVSYLAEARAAMKEKRDLMGVKPILAPESSGDTEVRYAGKSREQILSERIARLEALRQQALSASNN